MRDSAMRNRKYLALAFLLPCVGMLFVMLMSGYTPFGQYSMLYSDMYHQYYPFFVAFRKAILSGQSLLYDWSVGLGMDYLGLISYYLASPLNLLSVLVPEGWVLQYFSLLVPIKLGLAGLFFALFLRKIFSRNDLSIVFFGGFYGLCAWALGFQWNVMWLDTFALLPLVMMGMVSLLKERKFVLYTFTLFLSIYANYYIGFFTCIFVLLTFICYEICRWRGPVVFIKDLLCMAVFSLIAIGMTAILELPALAALQTTQSGINSFPKGFRLNIADRNTWQGLLDAMRQVAGNQNGGLNFNFKEGLPNLHCGVVTNILAFLFLTCRQVKLREKLCCVFLLLFFNVSFIIRQLDYIWHGFHFTNMIPYRFSFLYSFVLLYMAYRAYTLRRRFRLWQLITAGVLALGLMFCGNDYTDTVFWVYNSIFLAAYLFLFSYGYLWRRLPEELPKEEKKTRWNSLRQRRQLGGMGLFVVFSMELVLCLVNFGVRFPGTGISNYPKGTQDAVAAVAYMQEREADNLFFRAETTHSQTLNDGAINHYNGISAFTSSANVRVTKFMQALGYGAKDTYNRYCFEDSSPVNNLFLGLKFMLVRVGKVTENPYFNALHSYGNVTLLENNAYLPLGFLANGQLVNVDFVSTGNRFRFQNELFTSATGITQDVWELVQGNCLQIEGFSDSMTLQPQTGYCAYSDDNSPGGIINYRYTADREGLFCFFLDQTKRNSFSVWKNGKELYSETYSLPQMLSVSTVRPGDIIEIKLTCKENEKGTISIQAAILNEPVFRDGYDVLAASTLELTQFQTTRLTGTIRCNRSGVLYTSIPQNGNWIVYVDGQEGEMVTIGDAMVGVLLSEGYHEIAFRYENRAFSLGWKISLLSAALLAVAYFYFYRPSFKRKRGKYEAVK